MISDRTVAHLRDVTQAPDLSGTPYTLLREIARGGMAIVYEAHDARLDRAVALKVLALELSSSAAAQRMRGEARTIAGLEHPGIVPIHDMGELPDGRVFYAMKLVRGRTLAELAVANPNRTRLLRLFLRICDAVAFAHTAGIIHRDLKPENVMTGEFGEVLVMDWGVAATADSCGEIAGTKGFMAPEQLQGVADRRADIYALGAIVNFIAGVEDGPTPKAMRAIIDRATNPDAGARYGDVMKLADDVTRFLDGHPVSVYRENVVERAARWARRNVALIAVVAAYLVMRLMVFFWLGR